MIKKKTIGISELGFFRLLSDEEFEFHFTAFEAMQSDLFETNYYKMPFRKDLISVMKRCGGIPEPSMDSYVKTIEKVREQELMLAKSHDENAKAQEEIARLKSLTDS